VENQFRQAMDNVAAWLSANGTDLSRVASVSVFLSDTRHFGAMNEVYRTYFPTDPPTRATVGVDLPMAGALVQIAAVAVRSNVDWHIIRPGDLKSPELPYSWGIVAGNTLFVAGATSRDPETYQPVTGDIATQTRRALGNIGSVLRAAEMDYGDLASCTVFMQDPREFPDMNSAYREFMTDTPPARATVRARLVNPDFKVEIQCVAQRGANRAAVLAEGAAPPSSPFSPAIAVGSRLYLAGMVGAGPDGIARGDVEAQTRQTLSNLEATLTAAGGSFDDVTSVSVFVPHIVHAETVRSMLEARVGTRAARTVIGAALMGPDPLVEIMMTAQLTERR